MYDHYRDAAEKIYALDSDGDGAAHAEGVWNGVEGERGGGEKRVEECYE